MLKEYIDIEKQRPYFDVLATEKKQKLTINNIEINGIIIIDYIIIIDCQ